MKFNAFYDSWKKYLINEAERAKKFSPYSAAYAQLSDEDKQDPHIDALLKVGYVPIQKVTKGTNTGLSALLGRGAYGQVYEAVDKKGRRMAVKVFDDPDEGEKEAEVRRTIKQRIESISDRDFVKKHLVKFDQMMIVPGETPDDEKYIISMEILRPMTTTERSSLYKGMEALSGDYDPLTLYFKMFKFYPNLIVAEIRKYMQRKYSSEAFKRGLKLIIKPEISETALNLYILKQISDLKESVLQTIEADKDINSEWLDVKIKDFADLMADMISDNMVHDARFIQVDNDGTKTSKLFLKYRSGDEQEKALIVLKDYIADVIYKAIENSILRKAGQVSTYNKNIANYKKFSTDYEFDKKEPTKQQYAMMDKKVQRFVKAMYRLAKTYKIFWSDLHKSNIMINPQTGDYVASDLGLFDFGKMEQ
jgi:serine/threonine protein kinase